MTQPLPLRWDAEGLWLHLKVLPRASRSAILPPDGEGLLPVRLQAPPVDGAANAALLALLSEALGWPKVRLQLRQGRHSRRKLVCALGAGATQAQCLASALALPLGALSAQGT